VLQIAEKTFLTGLGALSLAREKAKKVVDELAKKGGTARDETMELIRKLEDKGKVEKESLRAAIGPKCCTAGQLRLATRQDIERLEQKLDELREKLS